MANSNLHKAKTAKNDEFYTQLTDIEQELKHYKEHFRNKTVYLNCDDHKSSKFFTFFSLQFEHLGLKKLIATHYEPDGQPSYALIIDATKDLNGDGIINAKDTTEVKLNGNGDFRSKESLKFLEEADIVVTNPPFSLFREYIAQLMHHKKQFLVVGSLNAITMKEIFPLIRDNKLWLGHKRTGDFLLPDGTLKAVGALWYTNLDHAKRHEPILTYQTYSKEAYPTYDNYDAINVNKTKDIPKGYKGYMGVPISFLEKFNPNQFEVIGIDRQITSDSKRCFINGKEIYARVVIRLITTLADHEPKDIVKIDVDGHQIPVRIVEHTADTTTIVYQQGKEVTYPSTKRTYND